MMPYKLDLVFSLVLTRKLFRISTFLHKDFLERLGHYDSRTNILAWALNGLEAAIIEDQ